MNTTQITRTFELTHTSFFGFDGESRLWSEFPNSVYRRTFERGPRLKGSRYHDKCFPAPYSGEKATIAVTSDFVLGGSAVVEYRGKRYSGTVNFGFDQSVLALHIWEVGDPEKFFKNAVKLYTTQPTTKDFLRSKAPLLE